MRVQGPVSCLSIEQMRALVIFLLVIFFCAQAACGVEPDPMASEDDDPWTSSFLATARSSLNALFGLIATSPAPPLPPSSQAGPKISSSEVRERVELARELLSTNSVDDAIDVLLTVLERSPGDDDSVQPNFILGTAFLTVLNDPHSAVGFLYNAVSLQKWSDPVSIANLCAALSLEGDDALAERVALRGIDVGKASPNTTHILGQSVARLMEKRGDFKGAADWYLSAALSDPGRGVEPWLKASTLKFPEKGQDLEIGESVLLRAFPHHPNSIEVLYLLAQVLHRRERVKESVPIYRRAISLAQSDSDTSPARQKLVSDALGMYATALHATGKLTEALDAYEKAVNSAGRPNVVLLANYAMCLCDKIVGRNKDGRAMVSRASKVASNSNSTVGIEDVLTAERLCGTEESIGEEL